MQSVAVIPPQCEEKKGKDTTNVRCVLDGIVKDEDRTAPAVNPGGSTLARLILNV
jgi:hypothetical protein